MVGKPKVPETFVDYIARNYSGTVEFHDPRWHAERIWQAFKKVDSIERWIVSMGVVNKWVKVELTAKVFDDGSTAIDNMMMYDIPQPVPVYNLYRASNGRDVIRYVPTKTDGTHWEARGASGWSEWYHAVDAIRSIGLPQTDDIVKAVLAIKDNPILGQLDEFADDPPLTSCILCEGTGVVSGTTMTRCHCATIAKERREELRRKASETR